MQIDCPLKRESEVYLPEASDRLLSSLALASYVLPLVERLSG